MIQFTQTLSEQDYRLALREYYSHYWLYTLLLLLGIPGLGIGVFLLFTPSWMYSVGIILLSLLFIFMKRLQEQKTIRLLQKSPHSFQAQHIMITDAGYLDIRIGEDFSHRDLKHFHQALDSEHYLLLFPQARLFHILKKEHLSLEQYHKLEDIIFHNIKNHRTIFQTRRH